MFRRIPQPPINPAARSLERQYFFPGFALLLVGALLALRGGWHATGINTVEDTSAWETQLVKAFSSGGLKFPERLGAAPPPPRPDNPEAAAEALERWASRRAAAETPTWKVRVDPEAKTPCPT